MPQITFIHSDGTQKTLQSDEGMSVMQAATSAGLRGILAECGGSAMCATCHVYVDASWLPKLPPPLSNELEMLECTASERRPESRLSCQIKLTPALDGLVVHMPQQQ